MRLTRRSKKWAILAVLLLLTPCAVWTADKIWPLPLNEVQMARIVVAQDGTPLWRFADSDGIWRYPVTLDQVSPYYLEALINYEDRRFYQHHGVNVLSIGRALWQNLVSGRIVSGGSTISMQVARLIEPHDRTVAGKIKQLWRTFQLEWYLSKDEILTLYLNRAPYGGTLQGIGAASWSYLAKPPSELTRSEAALMAVLPQAPSRLRPDRYPKLAQAARDKVLNRLADYGVWPQDTVNELLQESVYLSSRTTPQSAPLLARRMINQYPKRDVIQTTIDATLQRRLEGIALSFKNRLPAKNSLAIIVVDHTTMEVKGYVGSADFSDDDRYGHVDMIRAVRSPGSTLKPFMYAMAMDEGLIHSESLLQDVPRHFGDYRPGNFDSGFNGPVSVSESLTKSLNLPVVQLLEAYGPKRFTANLRNTGVDLVFPVGSEPNLSLILGGTGVRMDQLVSAYSALARQGNVAALRFTQDEPLAERRLTSAGAAWIVRRILAGESRPLPDNMLPKQVPLAWKTGTSYGYRDAWAIGVNARYVIGVWVGRPDATPVAGQFGFATAIPILYQVDNVLSMQNRYSGESIPLDPRPSSVSWAMICWPQGQPLAEGDINCRQRRYAWIIDRTTPPTLAAAGQDLAQGGWLTYWQNQQGLRVAADCPDAVQKRMALWPLPLEPWLPPQERRASRLPPRDKVCPPLGGDPAAPLLIKDIKNNMIFKRIPGKTDIDLAMTAQGGAGQRWWFLNGELIGQNNADDTMVKRFTRTGKYQLVVLDESGQLDKVSFAVE
jgi:penicillin-binding protein 1C